MFKFIVKRFFASIFILFGVSILIYFLVRMMPADYVDQHTAAQVQSGQLTQEDVQRMKELYGIGDSSFTGKLKSYGQWASKAIRGDFGVSFVYGRPVREIIGKYMWISFGISFVALILNILISIPLGIVAATKQYGVVDYVVTILAMMGISLPSFFLGALLLRVFALQLNWFPLQGLSDATRMLSGFDRVLDNLHHLILPMVTLVVLSIGSLMRYTRTNMLEVLNSDYIRTARAKGLSEKVVIYKHAFRNTLIPIVTMLGGSLPGLFAGAMITETVYAIPGIGYTSYKAMLQGDIPFVMGYMMFLAVLTVLGTILADISYAIVDPRVKLR
ncbi:ABC transporter permease [Clostridium sp. Marseille-P299]|uniref:ABC transporter permease n=1 Tax=Clostridium sp. Marseille-P299 TaxID=1805477 RepID=UPI0008345179|nr:ABC transporter permease [Clostridium sp. Marseille-P299]